MLPRFKSRFGRSIQSFGHSSFPCVSLLDFWRRAGRLELVVYAHSIDFGKRDSAIWCNSPKSSATSSSGSALRSAG